MLIEILSACRPSNPLKIAHASQEPFPRGVEPFPRRVSEVERLNAELTRLRSEVSAREAELVDLRSRLAASEHREEVAGRQRRSQRLESLGVLAGGVAHELNNVLMSILGHADLARHALSSRGCAEGSIEKIEQSARRAADLAHQMLAFSGKGQFVVSPLDLSRVVREMGLSPLEPLGPSVRLELDLAESLPEIEADVRQLRQITRNLLVNAVEAQGEDGGTVSITTGFMDCRRAEIPIHYLTEGTAEGPYVYLEVADDGCGMDRATAGRVFEPFFSTKFVGRGLGLAAACGVVRGHRGAVGVNSTPGEGTTIRMLFPVIRGNLPNARR